MTRLHPAPDYILRKPRVARPEDNGAKFTTGQRHAAMLTRGGALRNVGAGYAEIEAALLAFNRDCCDPPKDEAVVRALAADIVERYGPDEALRGRLAELHAEIDELQAQANGAAPAPRAETQAATPTKRLEIVSMEEAIARADEPLPAVIEGFAYTGFVTVFVGKHSAGKSMASMCWGVCCHRGGGGGGGEGGGEVAGIRCEPATALYVDSENGPLLLGRRFRDADIPADGLLVAVPRAGFRLQHHMRDLRALIEAMGAQLVFLDALRRLAPGARENESEDMAPLIAGLAEIARDLNVAIVVLHHRSTKAGAATMRGSSAIEDQADIVVALERRGDRRKLTVKKFRIGPEPAPVYFDMTWTGGVLGLAPADGWGSRAREGDDEPDDDIGTAAHDVCADRIRGLAEHVARDDGWPRRQLAAAVNEKPQSGTFDRALKLLYAKGEWESTGSTSANRIRPTVATLAKPLEDGESWRKPDPTVAASATPLGDGDGGESQGERLFDARVDRLERLQEGE